MNNYLTEDKSYYKQMNDIGYKSINNHQNNVYEIVFNNTIQEKRYFKKPTDGENEYRMKNNMKRKVQLTIK